MTTSRRGGEETLSGHYLALACHQAVARGIDVALVLDGTGLDAAALDQPGRQVPLTVCLRLFSNLMALDPEPGLGIAFGRQLDIRSHGFLGYAILSSRTIGEALDLCIRYVRTRTSLFEIRLFREDDMAVVKLDERVPLGAFGPLLMDTLVTLMAVGGQQLTGRGFNGSVRLAQPCQPHHRHWPELAQASLLFDAAFTQFRFPRVGLQLPIAQPDPQLLQMATAQCEEELRRLHDSGGLLADVRRLAKQHMSEDASLERIASALSLSERTLRRRLAELGP
ncbi:MAG: AraC family transcriptional regulator, partial [Perlucidibaca sp.]